MTTLTMVSGSITLVTLACIGCGNREVSPPSQPMVAVPTSPLMPPTPISPLARRPVHEDHPVRPRVVPSPHQAGSQSMDRLAGPVGPTDDSQARPESLTTLSEDPALQARCTEAFEATLAMLGDEESHSVRREGFLESCAALSTEGQRCANPQYFARNREGCERELLGGSHESG